MSSHVVRKDVRMAQPASRGRRDTAPRILDVAERLVQARGFNGFSYADVAARAGHHARRACTTTSPARPSSARR